MRRRVFIIFYFYLIFAATLFAQSQSLTTKPKLAIVLSGGGAKGMAHIPLLKALDSLGIKPDLIVGNSMGSVIGGMYAIGYSADSIEHIAKAIEWDEIFATRVPYDYINNAERDEYEKYSLEIAFDNFKPSLPLGLIDGQELGMFLSKVALPVAGITDFDELPIPYRCVATDIVNGKEVIFSTGDIALAMRSSMSIPSVFTPVRYNDILLIDGGVLNNFPVNIAKEWGADIIIGSDVSGGLKSGIELESMTGLLFQSAMISSSLKNPEQQQNCDVLLNHMPYLQYGTGDFKATTEIIQEGKLALNDNIDQIIKLLEPLLSPEPSPNRLPTFDQNVIMDEIIFRGASNVNQKLLKEKFGFDEKTLTINDLEDKIRQASGSRTFKKITYYFDVIDGKRVLTYEVDERLKTYVKGGIHFDTERGAGIIINMTTRNFIGRGSRTLFSVDAAENPKFRVQQQGYITSGQKFWYRAEFYNEKLVQKSFESGQKSNEYYFNHNEGSFQLNRDLSNNAYLSAFYLATWDNYQPVISPETRGISSDSLVTEIIKNEHKGNAFGLRFVQNNLNRRFFPTAGSLFELGAMYQFDQQSDIYFYGDLGTLVNPLKIDFDGALQINLNYHGNFSFNEKLTLQPKINLLSQLNSDTNYYPYGLQKYFFIGGMEQRARSQYITFSGLREGELFSTQTALSSFDVQWEIRPNLFISPNVSAGITGILPLTDFLSELYNINSDWNSTNLSEVHYLYSYGLKIGMMSPTGPIQLGIAKVNKINKLRVYFSLGMHFL